MSKGEGNISLRIPPECEASFQTIVSDLGRQRGDVFQMLVDSYLAEVYDPGLNKNNILKRFSASSRELAVFCSLSIKTAEDLANSIASNCNLEINNLNDTVSMLEYERLHLKREIHEKDDKVKDLEGQIKGLHEYNHQLSELNEGRKIYAEEFGKRLKENEELRDEINRMTFAISEMDSALEAEKNKTKQLMQEITAKDNDITRFDRELIFAKKACEEEICLVREKAENIKERALIKRDKQVEEEKKQLADHFMIQLNDEKQKNESLVREIEKLKFINKNTNDNKSE